MADSIVINPTDPTDPVPAPTPGPATAITPESLKNDFDVALRLFRGVTSLLPAGPKATMEKVLSVAETIRSQDWAFDVLVNVLGRFTTKEPTADDIRLALFKSLVVQGDKVAAEKAPVA